MARIVRTAETAETAETAAIAKQPCEIVQRTFPPREPRHLQHAFLANASSSLHSPTATPSHSVCLALRQRRVSAAVGCRISVAAGCMRCASCTFHLVGWLADSHILSRSHSTSSHQSQSVTQPVSQRAGPPAPAPAHAPFTDRGDDRRHCESHERTTGHSNSTLK